MHELTGWFAGIPFASSTPRRPWLGAGVRRWWWCGLLSGDRSLGCSLIAGWFAWLTPNGHRVMELICWSVNLSRPGTKTATVSRFMEVHQPTPPHCHGTSLRCSLPGWSDESVASVQHQFRSLFYNAKALFTQGFNLISDTGWMDRSLITSLSRVSQLPSYRRQTVSNIGIGLTPVKRTCGPWFELFGGIWSQINFPFVFNKEIAFFVESFKEA